MRGGPVCRGRLARTCDSRVGVSLHIESKRDQMGLQKYYLVEANGERRPLTGGKEIFQESTIYLDPGNPDCKVIADSFWYGPQEQIDNQQHVVLKKLHPECDKGLVTPTK